MRFSWLCAPVAWLLAATTAPAQILLNEVLPAPGTDWTGNGIYSSQEDEWVELVNVGVTSVDLSEYFIADPGGPRAGFSEMLAPGDHQFVTGELSVDWETANGFPAVGLSLNNGGDVAYLFHAAGGTTTLVDSVAWSSSAADVSIGRMPDGAGVWTTFDALLEGGTGVQPTPGGVNGGIASPKILSMGIDPTTPTSADSIRVSARAGDTDGIAECLLFLTVDGSASQSLAMSLVQGTASLGTWEIVLEPHAAGTSLALRVRVSDGILEEETNDVIIDVVGSDSPIVLNEILADPPPDLAGDANGDGVRSTSDDEFVELINRGVEAVDLTGWTLHDATALRHEFVTGPVLPPGDMVVVFGGGTPTGIPSAVVVASSGGLSLNNTGDELRLVGPDVVIRDVHGWGGEANADQSLIRLPDGDGDWTRPFDAGLGWAFSPGLANAGPSTISEVSWGRIKALYQR